MNWSNLPFWSEYAKWRHGLQDQVVGTRSFGQYDQVGVTQNQGYLGMVNKRVINKFVDIFSLTNSICSHDHFDVFGALKTI